MGLQLSTEELMNTIPFLDTVAGEALSMLWGSKTIWTQIHVHAFICVYVEHED